MRSKCISSIGGGRGESVCSQYINSKPPFSPPLISIFSDRNSIAHPTGTLNCLNGYPQLLAAPHTLTSASKLRAILPPHAASSDRGDNTQRVYV